MNTLSNEIQAFESMRNRLEVDYFGKWVVIYEEEFVGSFDGFQDAANFAVQKYGRGPYLIRKVGEQSVTLPASVLYREYSGANDSV